MKNFFQILRFGIVGSAAALTHLGMLAFGVEILIFPPMIANIFAFSIAFLVSFYGHHHWTFAELKRQTQVALPRFFIIAVFSFLLNQSLFFLFLNILLFNYLIAMIMVLLIIPPVTFLSSKLWAFRR